MSERLNERLIHGEWEINDTDDPLGILRADRDAELRARAEARQERLQKLTCACSHPAAGHPNGPCIHFGCHCQRFADGRPAELREIAAAVAALRRRCVAVGAHESAHALANAEGIIAYQAEGIA